MSYLNFFFFFRLERKKREKEEQVAYKLEQEIALWDPTSNEESTTDPFKTLFVGRINFYTSESKIRREFETYGPIKQIKMIHDKETGKPKGYCFIEYEHERDMHCKYSKRGIQKPLPYLYYFLL
jgi:U1 small nuclear ribonucleoprotein